MGEDAAQQRSSSTPPKDVPVRPEVTPREYEDLQGMDGDGLPAGRAEASKPRRQPVDAPPADESDPIGGCD